MKKIFFILLFLPLFVAAQQTGVNNNFVVGGNLTVGGMIADNPAENYWAFKDSAVVITGGANVQITNATDSLWRNLVEIGITRLSGDTMQIVTAGVYNIYLGIGGSGANGADWAVQVAQDRGGVITYSNSEILMTTTGAANKVWGFSMYRRDALVGDKYWFVITRLAGIGDFTANAGTMKTQMYYKK